MEPAGERLIDPARYTEPAFARAEWEGMFCRVWVPVAAAGEVAEPGAFVTRQLGPEPLVIVRDDGGSLRVFHNVCPHRGNLVCHADHGRNDRLRCRYHGWSWDLRGAAHPPDEPDRATAGAPLTAARAAVFAGVVWVCLDPNAPGLRDYLGDVAPHLERYTLDQYALTAHTTVQLACNWKAFVDGVNEPLHIHASHPQLLDILDDVNVALEALGDHGRMAIRLGVASPRLTDPAPPPGLVELYARYGLDVAALDDPRVALAAAIRARGAQRGFDYAALTDDELTSGVNYYVFPCAVFDMHPERFILVFALPHVDVHACWVHELSFERRAPVAVAGAASPVRRKRVEFPRESISEVMDQDARNLVRVQQGMRSRAFRGLRLGAQEARIAHMHRTIDSYLRLHLHDGAD